MNRSILIVDDSRLIREMIKAIVQQHFPDWTIHEACDGLQALMIMRDKKLDAITLDIHMPAISGMFLAPDVREYQPKARVAIISSSVTSEDKGQGKRLGMRIFPKPVDEAKLVEFLSGVED